MSDSPSDEDDGGIFCQSCSPTTRKCGYYITFIIGFIGFIFGAFVSFGGEEAVLIISCIIILLCPLWIKSPKKCLVEFKNLLKVVSFLVFVLFLVLAICAAALDWTPFLRYFFGVFLAIAGCWYFLSFFPNGQQACINCLKTCCGKESA